MACSLRWDSLPCCPWSWCWRRWRSIGAWQHRLDAAFAPFFIYAIALFAASGLLFAIHVPYGTFIHSAVALLPHTYLLVIAGIGVVVAWVARRRSTWDAHQATRIFIAGAVGVAILGATLQTVATIGRWSDVRATESQLTATINAASASDRVMAADPGAIHYLTGHAAIVTPDDDLATIEGAMQAYDVRWLLLERAQIVPALVPVLSGEQHPDWLSQPVAVAYGNGTFLGGTAPDGSIMASAALYAVCLSDSDTRCSR